MNDPKYLYQPAYASAVPVNKVLRNTYMLLGLTLTFSAIAAYVAYVTAVPLLSPIALIIGFYGLFFVTYRLRNSGWGLLSTFALTGFLGYALGPVLNIYLRMPNGVELVAGSLGMTALVFFGLSAYTLTTRKDMSFLQGFLVAGSLVLIAAVVLSLFVAIPGFQLAISAAFVLFSAAMIMFQTSAIVHGGETNYVMATIQLYVSIYNMFLSLLSLFGFANRD